MRQSLEDRLKSCRSKEEVETAYNFSMTSIHKDDPVKEPLQAAYNNVTQEFKKSSQYKRLPDKTEDEYKTKNKKNRKVKSFASNQIKIENKYLHGSRPFSTFDFKG